MSKSYSAKDVRVLEEVEHIRLNPGMYIGDTSNPAHLIEEALDNALDEALAGYAKIIAVMIDTKENSFSVLDDGRGIPIEDNTPVTISSKLFSGAKFQDKKTAYEISSGLHGVGLVAVNALSKHYKVEIYRNKQHATYKFREAKLKASRVEKHEGPQPFSTKIEFTPDKKFFESLAPNLKRIRQRLTAASAEMPEDISFVLYIDGKKEIFKLSYIDYFKQNCLTGKDEVEIYPIEIQKGAEKFNVLFTYEQNGQVTPKHISSINLLPVTDGGVHLNCFLDQLKEYFALKGKKFGFNFQLGDILVGLRVYLSLSLREPKFSGQTKDRLINLKSDMEVFTKQMRPQIEKIFEIGDRLETFLTRFQDYRKKLDSKKLVKNGSGGKRASTKFTKLRDCTRRDGELYIVEGDSAGGSIIQSRDARLHAVLPLRGKSIPNVTTKKDILNNKEVQELVMAIGTGIGPHFKLSKLRYSKIICATDADHDGNHIACLVSMCMAILLPEIVKSGHYYIAQTPLYAINEKKVFKPLWSDQELDDARKANKQITRFKGLGELSPHQLKICLLDEETRHFTPVSFSENMDDLIKLFSSAEEKRKLVGE
jgi:DNA gyrase/topoisomerase IV subunit B